jgi:hypothetical protein
VAGGRGWVREAEEGCGRGKKEWKQRDELRRRDTGVPFFSPSSLSLPALLSHIHDGSNTQREECIRSIVICLVDQPDCCLYFLYSAFVFA